jgi:exodeoxyribonuclease VII small subunit
VARQDRDHCGRGTPGCPWRGRDAPATITEGLPELGFRKAQAMSQRESEKNGDGAQELTFEQALAQLESIVSAIEQGKIGLQESISEYEKGIKLLRRCRAVLADAEMKIQQLQLGDDGKLTPAPMAPPGLEEDE